MPWVARWARCSPTCTPSTAWTSGFGAQIEEITTADGRATGLRFADGSTVEADAVLVGIGAVPNVELAREAGLDVDSGVLVDESLQSSDPDIVAVGDIAEQQHPVLNRRVRVEHWANALNQPAAAAATMLGHATPYESCPTSSPTSTTSAWSTSAWAGATTASWCAATRTSASSSRSGSTPTTGSRPA